MVIFSFNQDLITSINALNIQIRLLNTKYLEYEVKLFDLKNNKENESSQCIIFHEHGQDQAEFIRSVANLPSLF